MTTKDKVIQLTKDNLQRVFGETSAPKRLEMIRELWVPSSEALFVDPLGVFKSHEAISDMVVKIQAINPGQGFTEIGESSYI
jgi:lauroyl/myristoyl acyltransferase